MIQEFPDYILSEEEIQTFIRVRKRDFSKLYYSLGGVVVLAVSTWVSFYAMNASAYLRVANPNPITAQKTTVPTPANTTITSGQLNNPEAVTPVITTPTPSPTPQPLPDNNLSYQNLGISAPITWDIDYQDPKVDQLLPNSLVHFKNTAKPGQVGTVVITGHSSNYVWIKGSYNDIFAPLEKATAGDLVQISYQNKTYTYKTTKKYVIKPDQTAILKPTTGVSLRLITCTPIGTSLNRLVIEAVQI